MQIPLEVLPSSSALFLDYVREWGKVERFYQQPYALDAVERFARSITPDSDRMDGLARVLTSQQKSWNVDPGPAARLATGAVAVITGQQAGLFTGPLYAVLKALTAVKAARALKDRGVDAVPVFWIAAEDHDREEIEWAGILGQHGEFLKITAEMASEEGSPAGWMTFTDRIQDAIGTWSDALPASEYRSEVFELLEETYRPGVSPVDAFARLMGRLFQGTELIFVDPLDPGFRNLAESVMGVAFGSREEIRSAVLERSGQVSAAGYEAQVRVDDGFTGFFAYRGRSRQALAFDETAPASALSPNALLRPVVQDSILPTAAFVGGPAEIAYFAQAGAVYECLQTPMPPVLPRISATIVEPPVARVMKKYDFSMKDVFEGPEHLRKKAVGTLHDTGEFARARGEVVESIESLRPLVEGTDRTLSGAMDNALQKMKYQVDRLETRFVNAEVRRNETLDKQLAMVSGRLFPQRRLQERAVNVTSFLVRYGLDFVRMLDQALEPDGDAHQVVEL